VYIDGFGSDVQWYTTKETSLKPVFNVNPTNLFDVEVEIWYGGITYGKDLINPLSLSFEVSFDFS